VRAEAGLDVVKAAEAPGSRRPRLSPSWRVGALAASLVAALVLGYAWGAARTRANALFEEAVAQHVRSLQEHHLTDVASTDQHTVKPWFAGRVDFSPPVVDLAAAGFPLIGGRLDLLGGRPAAALVYGRRQHVVNLFLWPAGAAPIATRDYQSHGFNATSWSEGDLGCLAVSEIPASELAGFVATFRAQSR
jgi:anti-sigma factor RsiW